MTYESIQKARSLCAVQPNLVDYEAERTSFTWERARRGLSGQQDGGLNMAFEAVDRHLESGLAQKVAIRWLGRDESRRELTYADLADASARFANVLAGLGVLRGERVFLLAGRVPELYIAVLGGLKLGAVVCPLFSQFGPEPIRQRMQIGDAAVLVTTPSLYRKRVAPIRAEVPTLRHVLMVGDDGRAVPPEDLPEGTLDLASLLHDASSTFEIPHTDPEDPALLHFTSGTTGKPKGAVHVHGAVLMHHISAFYALDLHPDDVFWCTADPGWVTGTSYGVLAPLTHGLTMVVDEADFDADRWYRILSEERVCVWYTAPTAVRMMMRAGTELTKKFSFKHLRFIASVGEPLNPEAVLWGIDAFGLPIHDNWWQTETGGIMIANYAASEVRPGSMGRPLPGITVGILVRDAEGKLHEAPVGTEGELALRTGWPSMFRGYLHEDERYKKCFEDGWYLSGDLARQDEDGFVWFIGRSDDVIKTSGHLIGPFEVESALFEHAAVAEAAVIGKPDPVAGNILKAFVSLKAGFAPSDQIRREILSIARTRLGPAVSPKEIDFLPTLPKTRSGKILRRLLRARELGLPEGDLSTLEADSVAPRGATP